MRLSNAHPRLGAGQPRARQLHFVIHARLHSLAGYLLGLSRRGLLLFEHTHHGSDGIQLGVIERSLQYDLVLAVGGRKAGGRPFAARGAVEFALSRIDKEILLVHVDDRGRGTFQAEREAIGRRQPGADGQLRQKKIAALFQVLAGPFFFCRGQSDGATVLQRQLNRAAKTKLLRHRRLMETQGCQPKAGNKKNSSFHRVTCYSDYLPEGNQKV